MRSTTNRCTARRNQSRFHIWLPCVVTAFMFLSVGAAGAGEDNSGLEDAMLEAKVRLALLTELGFDSLDVEVAVDNGNIVLSGDVDKRETRELSKSVVASVEGVQSVKNDIELKESNNDTAVAGAVEELERETQDGILETRIKLKLMQEIGSNAFDIHVDASDGKVVLTGHTDPNLEIDHVKEIVASVDGVSDVVNRITKKT